MKISLVVGLIVGVSMMCLTHRCAHHVTHAKVKAALLIHGVMQTG